MFIVVLFRQLAFWWGVRLIAPGKSERWAGLGRGGLGWALVLLSSYQGLLARRPHDRVSDAHAAGPSSLDEHA